MNDRLVRHAHADMKVDIATIVKLYAYGEIDDAIDLTRTAQPEIPVVLRMFARVVTALAAEAGVDLVEYMDELRGRLRARADRLLD